jgi:internalin A
MRRIGADAGLNGLYWEDGFHFYDGALAAQAIVEIVRPQDHSWRGLIRIAAKGDGAAALLGRLQMLCGEVGERFGAIIDGEALAARIAAGADGVVDDPPADVYEDALRARLDRRLEAAPATFAPAPPPMPQERCFISYAHGGDADEAARQRQLAFEAVLKRLPELGLEPFYDIEHLAHGESIDSFMALGAEQPKLTLILSEKYLHSPYCMDELRRIWRACGSQAAKFRARVRVLALPDAKFQTDDDQENIRNHWREQAADSHQRIETRLKAGERAEAKHVNTYNAAIEVKDLVVEILSCVADTIHVRNLSEIDKLRF